MAMIRGGEKARTGQRRMKLSTIAVAIGAVAAAALFAGTPYAFQRWVQARAQARQATVAQHQAELHPQPASLPVAPDFTRVQVVTFLEHAQVAEAISDPLKRCLAYPDPPGSHWSPAAVRAYCQYRYQPVLGMDEVTKLIQSGQVAKLDALLAAALQAQQTDPDARGRLDRIYGSDFGDASDDTRALLDAWKRQDPHSAFAWAASGFAYTAAAGKERGQDELYNTPRERIEAMERFAKLGDADLQQAMALNPHIALVYASMIYLGQIDLGKAYADHALQRGLAMAPDNLGIYDAWVNIEQPNWYGSLAAMDAIGMRAAGRVTANPLLAFETVAARLQQIYQCACTDGQRAARYRAVAQTLIGYGNLRQAGSAAEAAGENGSAGVYYAEALRFNDNTSGARAGLAVALVAYGFPHWALRVAQRAVSEAPGDDEALAARGFAYMSQQRWDAAAIDLKAAVAIDPKYPWAWMQLGRVYLQQCQWDDAATIAYREIRDDPGHSDGLELLGAVQVYEPRDSLADTAATLKQKFGDDAYVKQQVAAMEHVVAQRNAARTQAAHEHKSFKLQALPPPWFQQCKQYAHIKLVPCRRQPPGSGSGHSHILAVCPAGAAP